MKKPNKLIAEEFIEEFVNNQEFDSFAEENFSKEFIVDGIMGKRLGKKQVTNLFSKWTDAVPDYNLKIDEIHCYDNTVVASVAVSGTHANPFRDSGCLSNSSRSDLSFQVESVEPSNKKLDLRVDNIFIFSKGKIQRFIYTKVDLAMFRDQLGVYPPDRENRNMADQTILINRLKKLSVPALTTREVTCLAFTLSGFCAKQIALVLQNSHRTIESHLQHAFQKLICFNKFDCLEKMIENDTLAQWHDLCYLMFFKNLPQQTQEIIPFYPSGQGEIA